MKEVLVTGAAGFVGRYLLEKLVSTNKYKIIAITQSGRKSIIHDNIIWEICDIRQKNQIKNIIHKYSFKEVYHLAAKAITTESKSDEYYSVNTIGTLNLLSVLMEKNYDGKILITSTSFVYGNGEGTPITELSQLNPLNDYAGSKAAMEMAALSFINRGMNIVIARPFNHTGPYQEPHFVCSDFAKQFATIKLGKKEGILEVGNIGVYRDFTDVRDVVNAYMQLMDNSDVSSGIYNVCSGNAVQVREVLSLLMDISEMPIEIKVNPQRIRKSDMPVIVGDASKLITATKWETTISLKQTMLDLYNYWIEVEG